jgi:hypothetical protein
MNIDYLQEEAEPPYIEATVPKRNGLWIVLGVITFGVLIVGAKVYFTDSPSTVQGDDIQQVVRTSVPHHAKNDKSLDLPLLKNQYDQISRDPFQTKERQQAVKSARQVSYKKPRQKSTKMQSPHLAGQPRLNLKAIVLGARPKAFINDVFVSEGESFEVTGAEKVACQVITIDEQVVKVKVGQKIRVLRLASDTETEKNPWRF